MPNDDTWAISSSGHHMFVSFSVGDASFFPGFIAKIHHGNMIQWCDKCYKNYYLYINETLIYF